MIRRLLVYSLLAVVAGSWAARELLALWEAPLNLPDGGYALTVKPGDSLGAIAARLESAGVMPHARLFTLYGRWTGRDQQIKQGEFHVPPFTNAAALLDILERGDVIQYRVTLPEGITLSRAVEILQAQDELTAVLEGGSDPRLLALVEPHAHPEGWFFPDTYRYERGASDWSILQRAHAAMRDALAQEWEERAPGLPYQSPYDALIMASIIERETGLPEERGEIAGVFVRRLQRGMRLQTDPTIIYGLGAGFDGNLRRSHLRDESNPYNTYRHHGLPPSPIALPGRAALRAALNPEEGSSLFFVARGDGGHVFSETLAEHERAVRKYQLKRRADYRSSPPPASQGEPR